VRAARPIQTSSCSLFRQNENAACATAGNVSPASQPSLPQSRLVANLPQTAQDVALMEFRRARFRLPPDSATAPGLNEVFEQASGYSPETASAVTNRAQTFYHDGALRPLR
jgi:hypothetical protein